MIRVIVVDDHPVVRHGLVSMLKYEPDLQVVGEAGNGKQAVAAILDLAPDVVLLDLWLPEMNGIQVLKHVRPLQPLVKFLVLTTFDTDEYIVPALSAGAHGYLLKDSTPEELVRAIHLVQEGGAPLQSGIAAKLIANLSTPKASDDLSRRELEVVQLLVAGASNKQIAGAIHVSENTVKSHLSRIFCKLGVQSRAEAVAVALTRRLVSRE